MRMMIFNKQTERRPTSQPYTTKMMPHTRSQTTLKNLMANAIFTDPGNDHGRTKIKRSRKPVAVVVEEEVEGDVVTEEDQSKNTTEVEYANPEDFKVTITDGPGGVKIITPPKYPASRAKPPQGWEKLVVVDGKEAGTMKGKKKSGKEENKKYAETFFVHDDKEIATQQAPQVYDMDEKVPMEKIKKPEDAVTVYEMEAARNAITSERANLMTKRRDMDKEMMNKIELLKEIQKTVDSYEKSIEELTEKINKLATETPEERVRREREIEEEKRQRVKAAEDDIETQKKKAGGLASYYGQKAKEKERGMNSGNLFGFPVLSPDDQAARRRSSTTTRPNEDSDPEPSSPPAAPGQ